MCSERERTGGQRSLLCGLTIGGDLRGQGGWEEAIPGRRNSVLRGGKKVL